MNMITMVLFFASALEGFFFGSGKAHVVTGVALIILAGLAFSSLAHGPAPEPPRVRTERRPTLIP